MFSFLGYQPDEPEIVLTFKNSLQKEYSIDNTYSNFAVEGLKYFCNSSCVRMSISNKGIFDLVELLACEIFEKWPKTLHEYTPQGTRRVYNFSQVRDCVSTFIATGLKNSWICLDSYLVNQLKFRLKIFIALRVLQRFELFNF